MKNTYNKEYQHKGYKIKVKYNNTKSFEDFLIENITSSFVPKVIDEMEKSMCKIFLEGFH
ncbi:hypothetical protein [Psychrobacillus phage Perkons]|nr:hypothetical protein [Psychrobacillus phage Perkons]